MVHLCASRVARSSLGGVRDHKVCIVRWEAPGSSATDLHGPPLAFCSHRTAASECKAQQFMTLQGFFGLHTNWLHAGLHANRHHQPAL